MPPNPTLGFFAQTTLTQPMSQELRRVTAQTSPTNYDSSSTGQNNTFKICCLSKVMDRSEMFSKQVVLPKIDSIDQKIGLAMTKNSISC